MQEVVHAVVRHEAHRAELELPAVEHHRLARVAVGGRRADLRHREGRGAGERLDLVVGDVDQVQDRLLGQVQHIVGGLRGLRLHAEGEGGPLGDEQLHRRHGEAEGLQEEAVAPGGRAAEREAGEGGRPRAHALGRPRHPEPVGGVGGEPAHGRAHDPRLRVVLQEALPVDVDRVHVEGVEDGVGLRGHPDGLRQRLSVVGGVTYSRGAPLEVKSARRGPGGLGARTRTRTHRQLTDTDTGLSRRKRKQPS